MGGIFTLSFKITVSTPAALAKSCFNSRISLFKPRIYPHPMPINWKNVVSAVVGRCGTRTEKQTGRAASPRAQPGRGRNFKVFLYLRSSTS